MVVLCCGACALRVACGVVWCDLVVSGHEVLSWWVGVVW